MDDSLSFLCHEVQDFLRLDETSGTAQDYFRTHEDSNVSNVTVTSDLTPFKFSADDPKVVSPKRSSRKANFLARIFPDTGHQKFKSPELKKRKKKDTECEDLITFEPFLKETLHDCTQKSDNETDGLNISKTGDFKDSIENSPTSIKIIGTPSNFKSVITEEVKTSTIRRSLSLVTLIQPRKDESSNLQRRNSISVIETPNTRKDDLHKDPEKHITLPEPFNLSEGKPKNKIFNTATYKKFVFEKTLRKYSPSLMKPLNRKYTVTEPFEFEMDKRKRKADCDCCKTKYFTRLEPSAVVDEKREQLKCKRQFPKRPVKPRIRTNFLEMFNQRKNYRLGSSSSTNTTDNSGPLRSLGPFGKKRTTVPKPFSFQLRNENRLANKSKKSEMSKEEKQVQEEWKEKKERMKFTWDFPSLDSPLFEFEFNKTTVDKKHLNARLEKMWRKIEEHGEYDYFEMIRQEKEDEQTRAQLVDKVQPDISSTTSEDFQFSNI